MNNLKSNQLPPDGIIPLAPNQKRLYMIREMDQTEHYYNIAFSVTLEGEIDYQRLDNACNSVINKHNAFRTEFISHDQAHIIKSVDIKVIHKQFDIEPYEINIFEEKVISFLEKISSEWFDIKTAPLARLYLIKLNKDFHIFHAVFHHIICDASSFQIFLEDIIKHYVNYDNNSKIKQQTNDLSNIQYSDYVIYKNLPINPDEHQHMLAFWREQLKDFTPHNFPTDFSRNPLNSDMKEILIPLDQSFLTTTLQIAKEMQTTTFKVLLAAYAVLINRYTNENSFIVGVPATERKEDLLKPVIGYLIQTLPIRFQIAKNMSFKELLIQATDTVNAAVKNKDIPLMDVLKEIKLHRDGVRDPLFRTFFNFVNFDFFEKFEFSGITGRYLWANSGSPYNDFGVLIYKIGEKAHISIKYDALLFKESTIKRLYQHWLNILESVAKNLEVSISDICILSTAEFDEITHKWNEDISGYGQPYEANMVEVLEWRALKSPTAFAAIDKNHQYTYEAINKKANQLCYYLKNKFQAERSSIIAVCLGRTVDLLVSVLAIIKAGAAYAVIDPDYPQVRVSDILLNAKPVGLITSNDQIKLFSAKEINLINLTLERDAIALCSNNNPINTIKPTDLAYLVYTSGSTGKPKGVEIAHQGLVNLCHFQKAALCLDETKRVLQFSAVGFDAFTWEWVSCVYSGAALVFIDTLRVGTTLANALNDFKITNITLPPSILHTISPSAVPTLETVVVAGEECDKALIVTWKDKVRFINAYGPSENTVCASYFLCQPDYPPATIGKHIPGVTTYILDEAMKPVPIGVTGELYVGGIALSLGYKNNPEQTAKSFVPNPFTSADSKLYRTGDLCYFLEDGNMVFMGRKDSQVKIRGHRIEINEILTAIYQFGGIENVEVIDLTYEGQKSLAAFVVFNIDSNQADSKQTQFKLLKTHLKKHLPAYMIPSFFYAIEKIPLTENSKVDKKALIAYAADKPIQKQAVIDQTVESQLSEIWKNIFNVHEINVYDNFFDLGGQSLLAISLAKDIAEIFHIDFDVATVFTAPTLSEMADHIKNNKDCGKKYLIPLSKSRKSEALYSIHPIGGTVTCYKDVSELLNPYYSLVGIPSIGLFDPAEIPDKSIPDMAERYIREIKKHQPDGPYNILGFCMGGIIAFEIARQLIDSGEDIKQLIIVDSFLPNQLKNIIDISNDKNLALLFLRMSLAIADKLEIFNEMVIKLDDCNDYVNTLKNILVSNNIVDKNISFNDLERMLLITQENYKALINYKMDKKLKLNTTVNCVLAEETKDNIKNIDASLYSNNYIASNINLIINPGCHDDIIFKKRAGQWVKSLTGCRPYE